MTIPIAPDYAQLLLLFRVAKLYRSSGIQGEANGALRRHNYALAKNLYLPTAIKMLTPALDGCQKLYDVYKFFRCATRPSLLNSTDYNMFYLS